MELRLWMRKKGSNPYETIVEGERETLEVTKPPILAWAALKLHETSPDLDVRQEIYIP